MARTLRDAKLDTRAARARLAVQPKPHWRTLVPGQLHLGYRRRRKDAPDSWVARRYLGLDPDGVGRYAAVTLGLADDYQRTPMATPCWRLQTLRRGRTRLSGPPRRSRPLIPSP